MYPRTGETMKTTDNKSWVSGRVRLCRGGQWYVVDVWEDRTDMITVRMSQVEIRILSSGHRVNIHCLQ